MCRGRRIKPEHGRGVRCAPGRQLQQKSAEVRVQYLRADMGPHALFFLSAPKAATDAGFCSSGTASALVRPGQRNTLGYQTGKAAGGVKTRKARKPGIHNHTHAFYGQ